MRTSLFCACCAWLVATPVAAQQPQYFNATYEYLLKQQDEVQAAVYKAQDKYTQMHRMVAVAQDRNDTEAAGRFREAEQVALRMLQAQQRRALELNKLIAAFNAAWKLAAERRTPGPLMLARGGEAAVAALQNGQILSADDNRNIQLITQDGGFGSLRAGGTMRVIDAAADRWELLKGGFYYARFCIVHDPLVCRTQRTRIGSPIMVAAVRGTEMDMRVEGGVTYLEVFEGTVEIQDTSGALVQSVAAGQRVVVRRTNQKLVVESDSIAHERWWQN